MSRYTDNPSSRGFVFTCVLSAESELSLINAIPYQYIKYVKNIVNDNVLVSGYIFMGKAYRVRRLSRLFGYNVMRNIVLKPACGPFIYHPLFNEGQPEVYECGIPPRVFGTNCYRVATAELDSLAADLTSLNINN